MFSRRDSYAFLTLLGASASGCAAFSPKDLAQPTSLTVEHALVDVGAGFAGMKNELRRNGDQKLGLYPCKVTVNLNVTASADQGGKLVLDASTAPTSVATSTLTNTVSGSVHAEQTNSSSATRGNTVAVELYSIACLPAGTLGQVNPDKVAIVTKAADEGLPQAPFGCHCVSSGLQSVQVEAAIPMQKRVEDTA